MMRLILLAPHSVLDSVQDLAEYQPINDIQQNESGGKNDTRNTINTNGSFASLFHDLFRVLFLAISAAILIAALAAVRATIRPAGAGLSRRCTAGRAALVGTRVVMISNAKGCDVGRIIFVVPYGHVPMASEAAVFASSVSAMLRTMVSLDASVGDGGRVHRHG